MRRLSGPDLLFGAEPCIGSGRNSCLSFQVRAHAPPPFGGLFISVRAKLNPQFSIEPLHDVVFYCLRHCFRFGIDMQLFIDVLDVGANRIDADEEGSGHHFIAVTIH
jgi:hypothetical protein